MKYFISLFKLPLWGLGVFLFLTLPACELLSNDPETNTDIPGLPPATQVGAETFGCLVNGEIWTPKGGSIGNSSLDLSYDPLHRGGWFSLYAFRIENDIKTIINIRGTGTINSTGVYQLTGGSNSTLFTKTVQNESEDFCNYYLTDKQEDGVYRQGTLTITKFELDTRIVSGTFEFDIWKEGCDTVKITHGRFDIKI